MEVVPGVDYNFLSVRSESRSLRNWCNASLPPWPPVVVTRGLSAFPVSKTRSALPSRPEKLLQRRTVAPPPLQRPVTLGELIRQLEDIGERLEQEGGRQPKQRRKRYSDREAIAQVASLAHREKLPETTAALSQFLSRWDVGWEWQQFDGLVAAWAAVAPEDLDQDRVGVFWALLFLCSQGRVDLQQDERDLFGPLQLRVRPSEEDQQRQGVLHFVPPGSAALPASELKAA